MLREFGRDRTLPDLDRLAGTGRTGTSIAGLRKAAASVGLKAEAVQMDLAALQQMRTKAVAWVDGDHYVAVLSVRGAEARVHDPNNPGETTVSTETLLRRSGGIMLTVEVRPL